SHLRLTAQKAVALSSCSNGPNLQHWCLHLSGWQDSNLRPPGPKPGAMTGLRYTPIRSFIAERQGFEPWRRLPVDRLAICSVTTPAPLLKSIRFCEPAETEFELFVTRFKKIYIY